MRFVDCPMIHDHDDHVLTSALSVRYEECDKIMRIVMMIMVIIISIIQSDLSFFARSA